MPASSSSVSSPARCSARACAREPAMSWGASRQSNWVDLLTARTSPRRVRPRTGHPTGGPRPLRSCARPSARSVPQSSASARPTAEGSRDTIRIESSPAMVPRTPSSPTLSIADARYCAAPGGVFTTTRFADASADTAARRTAAPAGPGARPVARQLGRRSAYDEVAVGRRGPERAPTSTRSRLRVPWVTAKPSTASSSASSV